MQINIMSYNTQHCLNYVTRQIDYDIITDTIKQCSADIIGLQEMRGLGDDEGFEAQTQILAERLGYYYYFAQAINVGGGNNPYGNAILSRYPIKSTEIVMIPDPEVKKYKRHYETRCILKATIDVGDGLNMLVTHMGLNPDEQVNAVETLLSVIPQRRCVLMGDFNMQPDNPILAPVKQRLYDTAQAFDCPKLSYPSDNPDVKIDYIFVSDDIGVIHADLPEIISSDHRPHTATIKLK